MIAPAAFIHANPLIAACATIGSRSYYDEGKYRKVISANNPTRRSTLAGDGWGHNDAIPAGHVARKRAPTEVLAS
jgi:hypothetical protein